MFRTSYSFLSVASIVTAILLGVYAVEVDRTVCFYNSKSYDRIESGYTHPKDLVEAVRYCTHLLYGFAKIEDGKVKVSNEDLDIKRDNYRTIVELKSHNPKMKVLLSVGGYEDENPKVYMNILEDISNRDKLVKSAIRLINEFHFDGIDLAWQFPKMKVNKTRSVFGSLWHNTKEALGAGHYKDEKVDEHRDQFTALIRRFRDRIDSKLLTITQLPNINVSSYFDIDSISQHVDQIHVMAFDFVKSTRNKYLADHSSPLITRDNRNGIQSVIQHWTHNPDLKRKIVLILPTHGNAWKITNNANLSGIPPLEAEGPTDPTSVTMMSGTMAYNEICKNLVTLNIAKKTDVEMRQYTESGLGSYAYRAPRDSQSGTGIWVSFEDSVSIPHKKNYVTVNRLGGIGLSDITMDDFRGHCRTGLTFPLLKTASRDYVQSYRS